MWFLCCDKTFKDKTLYEEHRKVIHEDSRDQTVSHLNQRYMSWAAKKPKLGGLIHIDGDWSDYLDYKKEHMCFFDRG